MKFKWLFFFQKYRRDAAIQFDVSSEHQSQPKSICIKLEQVSLPNFSTELKIWSFDILKKHFWCSVRYFLPLEPTEIENHAEHTAHNFKKVTLLLCRQIKLYKKYPTKRNFNDEKKYYCALQRKEPRDSRVYIERFTWLVTCLHWILWIENARDFTFQISMSLHHTDIEYPIQWKHTNYCTQHTHTHKTIPHSHTTWYNYITACTKYQFDNTHKRKRTTK